MNILGNSLGWKRDHTASILTKHLVPLVTGVLVPAILFGLKLYFVDLPGARARQVAVVTTPSPMPSDRQGSASSRQFMIIQTGGDKGAVTLMVKTPFRDRQHYLVVETDGSSPFVQDGPLTISEGAWQGSLALGNAATKANEFYVYVIAVRKPLPHGYPEVPRGPGVESTMPIRITQRKES